jgi:hypothetical protein
MKTVLLMSFNGFGNNYGARFGYCVVEGVVTGRFGFFHGLHLIWME